MVLTTHECGARNCFSPGFANYPDKLHAASKDFGNLPDTVDSLSRLGRPQHSSELPALLDQSLHRQPAGRTNGRARRKVIQKNVGISIYYVEIVAETETAEL